jgi:hypothetical protein
LGGCDENRSYLDALIVKKWDRKSEDIASTIRAKLGSATKL